MGNITQITKAGDLDVYFYEKQQNPSLHLVLTGKSLRIKELTFFEWVGAIFGFGNAALSNIAKFVENKGWDSQNFRALIDKHNNKFFSRKITFNPLQDNNTSRIDSAQRKTLKLTSEEEKIQADIELMVRDHLLPYLNQTITAQNENPLRPKLIDTIKDMITSRYKNSTVDNKKIEEIAFLEYVHYSYSYYTLNGLQPTTEKQQTSYIAALKQGARIDFSEEFMSNQAQLDHLIKQALTKKIERR